MIFNENLLEQMKTRIRKHNINEDALGSLHSEHGIKTKTQLNIVQSFLFDSNSMIFGTSWDVQKNSKNTWDRALTSAQTIHCCFNQVFIVVYFSFNNHFYPKLCHYL